MYTQPVRGQMPRMLESRDALRSQRRCETTVKNGRKAVRTASRRAVAAQFKTRIMDQFAKETIPISLEEEMRKCYLDYAMSVIVGRALPDVRDGLKPVHRRVLYAMHEMNNDWNRPYMKSRACRRRSDG